MTDITLADQRQTEEDYAEIPVHQLILKEAAYMGQRVTVSGTIRSVEPQAGIAFVVLAVPQRDGVAGLFDEVAVLAAQSPKALVPGRPLRVWGIASGLHIETKTGACGIMPLPLIRAERLE